MRWNLKEANDEIPDVRNLCLTLEGLCWTNQLPKRQRDGMLFERKYFLVKNYFAWHKAKMSSVIDQLFERYQLEKLFMP